MKKYISDIALQSRIKYTVVDNIMYMIFWRPYQVQKYKIYVQSIVNNLEKINLFYLIEAEWRSREPMLEYC